jgi:hypothetical protein
MNPDAVVARKRLSVLTLNLAMFGVVWLVCLVGNSAAHMASVPMLPGQWGCAPSNKGLGTPRMRTS